MRFSSPNPVCLEDSEIKGMHLVADIFEWNANTISTVLNMPHLLWFYHLLLSYSIPFQFASITPFHLWLCVPSGL